MADEKQPQDSIPSLIDGLDFGVLLFDQNLKVLWMNQAMERLFGLSRTAMHGEDLFAFFNARIVPRITSGEAFRELVFSSVASGSAVSTTELRLSAGTGEQRWVEYSSQVIEHGPFQGMRLDIYQDITMRKLLQREIDRHVGHLGQVIEGKTEELARTAGELEKESGERKRAEEQLEKEKEFSRQILETSPAFLVALDREGMIRMVSQSLLRALNRERGEVLGAPFFPTLLPADEESSAVQRFRDLLSHPVPQMEEYRVRTKEGLLRTVEWHLRPVCKEGQTVDFVLVVGIDITDRKAMEAALRASEDLYRTIFEHTLAATAIVDRETTIFQVNRAFSRLIGGEERSFSGQKLMDFVDPADWGALSTLLQNALASSREFLSGECHLRRTEGPGGEVVVTAAAIPGTSRFVLSFLDITEQKRAQQELAERNRFLSIIHQMIIAATSSRTLSESLTTLLEKSLQLLEYDAGAIYLVDSERKNARLTSHQGMPEWMIRGADRLDVRNDPYHQVFIEGKAEYRGREEMGLLSMAWVPFLADSDVIGAVHFLTGRQEAFSEEEKTILESLSREVGNAIRCGILKEELEDSNALANLYLDLLTHDINNANSVSLMYAELLVDMLEGEKREIAQKLSAGIRRSSDIITNVNLLRKIREEKVTLAPTALDDVIHATIEALPDSRVRYTPVGIQVCADPLLSEVFANLIGNSLKFGGKEVVVTIAVAERDGEVEISVTDTGPGIPDSLKPVLFRRFERGKTGVRGKGLGLYLCRMILERYGGRIWVENRLPAHPNQGVTFKFRIRKAGLGGKC